MCTVSYFYHKLPFKLLIHLEDVSSDLLKFTVVVVLESALLGHKLVTLHCILTRHNMTRFQDSRPTTFYCGQD